MTKTEFIEKIAEYVIKYAPQYGIKVHSPIIAQAILESAYGTSDKVYKDGEWRHNYFGLKWRDGRCAISNEYFKEYTNEQRPDGSYQRIVSRFCKFKSMEDCVIGYFQWTNIKNYQNLKGVTDPRQYLENIKADKYATSIDYVNKDMAVINLYDLTKYDTEVESKMIINVSAGHNPDGKVACGAIGLIKESTEARKVTELVISKLRSLGHTVYDCTCDNGKSVSDVLQKIVSKCNAHTVDLDVSIHFNSGANDKSGNGVTTGTEVLVFDKSKNSPVAIAQNTVNSISALGFKNRGVKVRPDLYFLRNTKAPAMLVECCFVDDKDDVNKYNAEAMATAIVKGITGQTVNASVNTSNTQVNTSNVLYRVQCGAYRNKANAEVLQQRLKAAGFEAVIVSG